ncbi:hypothetical protein DXN05_16980 [Deminuibacter soli]|uniref:Uncharacterized protein n=1 Tax=Deminuibacter soli TaxID=2291815 RepID=A0A3E1NGS4_9BACT|nr:hypothetical protein DXN05_16980 [Deminuibacter soli]
MLFNLFGYRLLFICLEQQHKVSLEASLDKNDYNNNDLFEIKIPLNIPYISDQQHFERVDGAITIAGKTYKYVKRKITNGELVLLCLPDAGKQRLDNAQKAFGAHANDLPGAKKLPGLVKKSFPAVEYEQYFMAAVQQSIAAPAIFVNTSCAATCCGYTGFCDQPPQLTA